MLVAPDPMRAGVAGTDGPRGAARVSFAAQVRVTEALPVDVVFPARGDGTLDVGGAPYPAVVFLQDEGVTRARYFWLAQHLATRGYVVVLPDHPFNLPTLDTDRAIEALRALREAVPDDGTLHDAVDTSAPAVVMGHGLGGTVAVRQWVAFPEFRGVSVLASFPAVGDDVTARAGSPAMLMAGAADVLTPLTRMQQAFLTLRAPRLYAQVEALNHYAWTDDVPNSQLVSDGPRPRDLAATRRAALTVVDLWLDETLRADADATAALSRGGFTDVTVLR